MGLFAPVATAVVAVFALSLPIVGGGGAVVATKGASAGSVIAQPSSTSSSLVVEERDAATIAPTFVVAEPIVAESDAAIAPSIADVNESVAAVGAALPAVATSEAPWDSLELQAVPRVLPPLQEATCAPTTAYTTTGAPSVTSAGGVAGTTSNDLAAFAAQYNAIRAANCLPQVARFVYDSCMELRLFWMAESPSSDPSDAWGHIGSVRIDGVPSVGCDGNLAGGSGNTGVTVATKWWDSTSHRASLYRPGTSTTGVCIAFAMTHGGNGDPYSFTRAAAKWTAC